MNEEKFIKGYYCNSFYKECGNAKIIGCILDSEDKLIHFFQKEIKLTSSFNAEIYCIKSMLSELEILVAKRKIQEENKVVIYGSGKGIIHRINHISTNKNSKVRSFKDIYSNLVAHKNWNLEWQKGTRKLLNRVLLEEKGINKNIGMTIKEVLENKDGIVFFDIEMNCTDDPHHNGWEAISLGAVKCNLNFEVINTFHSYIKPVLSCEISDRCRVLTGIKQSNIDSASGFNEVMGLFSAWAGECNNNIFVSWGIEDFNCVKRDMERDMERTGNETSPAEKIVNNHYDFQTEFSKREGSKHQISLKNALKLYNINFEGQQHDALHDSVNLAKLYKVLIDKSTQRSDSEACNVNAL